MRVVLAAARAHVASIKLTRDRSLTAGLVFAGGQSTRMGADKAVLHVDGQPLIARVLTALGGLSTVVIVGGNEDDFRELDVRWLADAHPGEGPLGALITGMKHVAAEHVVAAACDLPHLRASIVDELIGQLRSSGAQVATPLIAGTHQWHVAAWSNDALPALEDAFSRGERSLRSAANELDVVSVVFASQREFDDVDTPDDLARAFPSD